MSDNSNLPYLGIYTGISSTPPVNYSSYKWSKIKGEDGLPGQPGQNIINQQNNQPLKYWAGTEEQYNAIPTKDANTIYDIFK